MTATDTTRILQAEQELCGQRRGESREGPELEGEKELSGGIVKEVRRVTARGEARSPESWRALPSMPC